MHSIALPPVDLNPSTLPIAAYLPVFPTPSHNPATMSPSFLSLILSSLCKEGGEALPLSVKRKGNEDTASRNAMILTFLDKTEPPRSGMDAK